MLVVRLFDGVDICMQKVASVLSWLKYTHLHSSFMHVCNTAATPLFQGFIASLNLTLVLPLQTVLLC